MAKKNKKSVLDDLPEIETNMTAMIDIVFQLIIFFIFITDLSQTERPTLSLPIASEASEDKLGDPERLIINVYKDGSVEIAGSKVSTIELEKILYEEYKKSKDEDNTSHRVVLIRGDVATAYQHIQALMVQCARLKIYKLTFAAEVKEKE